MKCSTLYSQDILHSGIRVTKTPSARQQCWPESFCKSGKFLRKVHFWLMNFRILCNTKCPDTMQSVQMNWKVSGQSKKCPDNLENVSGYSSSNNELVAKSFRICKNFPVSIADALTRFLWLWTEYCSVKPAGDKRSSPQDSNPMPSGWSRCTSLTCVWSLAKVQYIQCGQGSIYSICDRLWKFETASDVD